jgi:hypothetical protein
MRSTRHAHTAHHSQGEHRGREAGRARRDSEGASEPHRTSRGHESVGNLSLLRNRRARDSEGASEPHRTSHGDDAVGNLSLFRNARVRDPREIAMSAAGAPREALPHRSAAERILGADLSSVVAVTGEAAVRGCDALGAEGFTIGNMVVVPAGADLPTIVHEATHALQQRGASGGMPARLAPADPGAEREASANEAGAQHGALAHAAVAPAEGLALSFKPKPGQAGITRGLIPLLPAPGASVPLALLAPGTRVTVISMVGPAYQVSVNGQTGFLPSDALDDAPVALAASTAAGRASAPVPALGRSFQHLPDADLTATRAELAEWLASQEQTSEETVEAAMSLRAIDEEKAARQGGASYVPSSGRRPGESNKELIERVSHEAVTADALAPHMEALPPDKRGREAPAPPPATSPIEYLDREPAESDPLYLDRFTKVHYDPFSSQYVLTMPNGVEVPIPATFLEGGGAAGKKGAERDPSQPWVYSGKLSSYQRGKWNNVVFPDRIDTSTMPNLLANLKENQELYFNSKLMAEGAVGIVSPPAPEWLQYVMMVAAVAGPATSLGMRAKARFGGANPALGHEAESAFYPSLTGGPNTRDISATTPRAAPYPAEMARGGLGLPELPQFPRSQNMDVGGPFKIPLSPGSEPVPLTFRPPPLEIPKGMSYGEMIEPGALERAIPGSTPLTAKSPTYDAYLGGTSRYEIVPGTKGKAPVSIVEERISGSMAISMKTVISEVATPQLVKSNVDFALEKAYDHAHATYKPTPQKSRDPIAGEPDVHLRQYIENPQRIVIVVNVPGEATQALHQAAIDAVNQSAYTPGLPPVIVIVQSINDIKR